MMDIGDNIGNWKCEVFSRLGDFKQHQEKVERCQITWKKFQDFFPNNEKHLVRMGVLRKYQNFMGNVKKIPMQDWMIVRSIEQHWEHIKGLEVALKKNYKK
jgi:hypothetical protein